MRRPHVYERSATRAARGCRPEPTADYGPTARAVLDAVPTLLRGAEAAGAVALARFLGQALTEAEGIVRRGPDVGASIVTVDGEEPGTKKDSTP